MGPKRDLSAMAQRADYVALCAEHGVDWLPDDVFAEYQAKWEDARAEGHSGGGKNPHGGKRAGAGRPKKALMDDDEAGQGAQIALW